MFNRPSLASIIAMQEADLHVELGSDTRFPAADRTVLARSVGGVGHELHGHLEWIATQANPATANHPDYLAQHAAWWGVVPKLAKAAIGPVLLQGVAGSVVQAGTLLQRADGAEYMVMESTEIAETATLCSVVAVMPGAACNAPSGTVLRLTQSIAGVYNTATVATGGLCLGTDDEKTEQLRLRLKNRVQEPPQGGAVHDYRTWALEVPGITRAWAYNNWVGRGTVGVAVVADDAASGPLPELALVEQVQQYISHLDRIAPGCEPFAFAPYAKPIEFILAGLLPANQDVRTSVEQNLRELLFYEAEPGVTVLISHIREAISQAVGEIDHVLQYPAENIVCAEGELATFGGIKWV